MIDWTGFWYASDKNIPVMSFLNDSRVDNHVYFESFTTVDYTEQQGRIVLPAWKSGITSSNAYQETALSAEAYLHEAGHANVFFGAFPTHSTATNKSCQPSYSTTQSRCCNSSAGCSRAIDEGIADYHTIILFPTVPVIGESLANDINGFSRNGQYRDYTLLRNLTAQQAYSLESDYGLAGQIHNMGLVWASLWFETRLAALAQFGYRGVRSVDKLFSKHILLFDGDSTFSSLCLETINEARFNDGGLVKSLFENECRRRGFVP